jgi:hypothetical protein
LSGRTLIETAGEEWRETALEDGAAVERALAERFGVHLLARLPG